MNVALEFLGIRRRRLVGFNNHLPGVASLGCPLEKGAPGHPHFGPIWISNIHRYVDPPRLRDELAKFHQVLP